VCPSFGDAGQYETLTGRAFGELDPYDPQNALITDIALAPRNASQKVTYIASFFIVKPIDMTKAAACCGTTSPTAVAESPSRPTSARSATSA